MKSFIAIVSTFISLSTFAQVNWQSDINFYRPGPAQKLTLRKTSVAIKFLHPGTIICAMKVSAPGAKESQIQELAQDLTFTQDRFADEQMPAPVEVGESILIKFPDLNGGYLGRVFITSRTGETLRELAVRHLGPNSSDLVIEPVENETLGECPR